MFIIEGHSIAVRLSIRCQAFASLQTSFDPSLAVSQFMYFTFFPSAENNLKKALVDVKLFLCFFFQLTQEFSPFSSPTDEILIL